MRPGKARSTWATKDAAICPHCQTFVGAEAELAVVPKHGFGVICSHFGVLNRVTTVCMPDASILVKFLSTAVQSGSVVAYTWAKEMYVRVPLNPACVRSATELALGI